MNKKSTCSTVLKCIVLNYIWKPGRSISCKALPFNHLLSVMLDQTLTTNKINDIRNYLDELLPLLKKESREIIDESLVLHTVERLFQLIVDSAIDLITHKYGNVDMKRMVDDIKNNIGDYLQYLKLVSATVINID